MTKQTIIVVFGILRVNKVHVVIIGAFQKCTVSLTHVPYFYFYIKKKKWQKCQNGISFHKNMLKEFEKLKEMFQNAKSNHFVYSVNKENKQVKGSCKPFTEILLGIIR